MAKRVKESIPGLHNKEFLKTELSTEDRPVVVNEVEGNLLPTVFGPAACEGLASVAHSVEVSLRNRSD